MLAACSVSVDVDTNRQMADLLSLSREALACRRSVASDPQYQMIAARMPLVRLYLATLAQMADTRFATDDEINALALWTHAIQTCREHLVDAVLRQTPASLAPFITSWNEQDQVFVLLVRRKLAWGEAVLRLRTVEAELFSKLTDQAVQIAAELNRNKQAELSRKIAIFNALTNLAP